MAQINKSNGINVIIESPWKKIIIVGIVIVAIVIITEFLGGYFEDKGFSIFSLKNINLSLLGNPYFAYPLLLIIILVIIFLVLRLLKSKFSGLGIVKSNGSNEVKRVLKIVDDLLEKLPEQEINKFAKTKDAELYKSVLKKHGVG